jgi:hypothetical protein
MSKTQVKYDFSGLDKIKKHVGKTGRVVIGFWGLGDYKDSAATATAKIAERHIYGLGPPERNPIGITDDDMRYIKRIERDIIAMRIDVAEGLKRIGLKIEKATLLRANKGKTIDGGNMAEYSESYKKQRQKRQRREHPPNLTMTGIMWQSYHHEVQMR